MREIVGPGWTLTLEDDGEDAFPGLKQELGIESAFRLGIVATKRAGYRIELVGVRWWAHWPKESTIFFRCDIEDPAERISLNLVRGRAWYGTARAFAEALWDRGSEHTRLDDLGGVKNFDALRPVYGGFAVLFRVVKKKGPPPLAPSADAPWFLTAEKAEKLYEDQKKHGKPMSWPDIAERFRVANRTLAFWRRRRRLLLKSRQT